MPATRSLRRALAIVASCSPRTRARREGRPGEADQLLGRQPATSTTRSASARCTGNVVITQGTLTIRADRIDFKQNADNSLSATAYGNPVAFRQKKRRRRRILRRLRAARRVRRREGAARALRPRAPEARQRRDPQQLHLLQHRDRAVQGRRPRPTRRRAADGPGRRACAACSSRSQSDGKDAGEGTATDEGRRQGQRRAADKRAGELSRRGGRSEPTAVDAVSQLSAAQLQQALQGAHRRARRLARRRERRGRRACSDRTAPARRRAST